MFISWQFIYSDFTHKKDQPSRVRAGKPQQLSHFGRLVKLVFRMNILLADMILFPRLSCEFGQCRFGFVVGRNTDKPHEFMLLEFR
jgi:hypothetical protein